MSEPSLIDHMHGRSATTRRGGSVSEQPGDGLSGHPGQLGELVRAGAGLVLIGDAARADARVDPSTARRPRDDQDIPQAFPDEVIIRRNHEGHPLHAQEQFDRLKRAKNIIWQ